MVALVIIATILSLRLLDSLLIFNLELLHALLQLLMENNLVLHLTGRRPLNRIGRHSVFLLASHV